MQNTSTLNVLLALDSFKGSVSAQQACDAITRGLGRACMANHLSLEPIFMPVSDGGEGLIECLAPTLQTLGYSQHRVSICGPHGQKQSASLLINSNTKQALIECAEAIGLELIPKAERTAVAASTFGLGQLIDYALNQGVQEINIGLGGSATNDCGIGMMQALGVQFLDSQGQVLGRSATGLNKLLAAQDLAKVAKIDDTAFKQRISQLPKFKVIGSCDVDNPLLGDLGATYIFGRQKGLTEQNIASVEQGMESFAQVLTQHYQVDHSKTPGAGAAGGLGAAIKYFFAGELTPGIDMVLQLQGITNKLAQAHLVIVGEGCMDGQSVHGKAPVGVARYAAEAQVPCVAICGALKGDPQALYEHHIAAMFSIAQGPMTLAESMEQAAELLEKTAENIGRCFLVGRHLKL